MYGKQTSNDITDFESFLLDDIPTSWNNRINKWLEENEKTTLQNLLRTWYFVSIDENLDVSYFQRDLSKTPVIDKTKKEVTFETKEWITETFTYDIDDMQGKVEEKIK